MKAIEQVLTIAFRLLEMSIRLAFMILSAVIRLTAEGISALMASRNPAPLSAQRHRRRKQWKKRR